MNASANSKTKPRRRPRRRANRQSPKLATPISQNIKSEPTAKAHVRKTNTPNFRQTRGGMLITHREYVADVSRSINAFATDNYTVNPGVSASFPWLAQVASRFESYTFERLDYIYEPMVPTTQPGTVMMAIDFDSLDGPPTTKTTLMAFQGATRTSPWGACRLTTTEEQRKKMVNERYIRTGTIAVNADPKTYDVGMLYVATIGTGTTAVSLGEIYVEYTIRLRTPQIGTGLAISSQRKANQTGTIVCNVVAGNINIGTHEAYVTGDVNSPMMLVSNLVRGALHIDPRYNKFRLDYVARPQASNWGNPISTLFANFPMGGDFQYNFFNNPSSPASFRYGRPQYAMYQPGVAGTNNPLIESIIFGETEIRPQNQYGPGRTSTILGFPSGIAQYNNLTIDYMLTALETETFPLVNPNWSAGVASTVIDTVIQFPTVSNTIGRGAKLVVDSLNTFSFNGRECIDKVTESEATGEKRSTSKTRMW